MSSRISSNILVYFQPFFLSPVIELYIFFSFSRLLREQKSGCQCPFCYRKVFFLILFFLNTAGSYQLSILYILVYICQSQSPSSSPHPHFPPLVPIRLFSTSVSLFLPCKPVHLYHFSKFHIHALIYDICFSLSDFTLYDSLLICVIYMIVINGHFYFSFAV